MPNTIDLFSGAGGLTKGFDDAGFTPLLAIDKSEPAIETLRHNLPAVGLVEDLTELRPAQAPISKTHVDGVIGGPPCQDFSVANYLSRGGEKTNLVFVFSEWVSHYEPEFFVMENVGGIKSVGDTFSELISSFPNEYTISHATLNAADFGVAQNRNRVFIVGMQSGQFTFPSSGGDSVNVSEAFKGLSPIKAGESDSNIPNHRAPNHQQKTIDRIANTEQGGELYESWSERIRLEDDSPAPTLKAGQRANYHFGHPSIPRGLTVRERARLQGFPDDYIFKGTITEQRTQTGNAVPPPVAKAIASELIDGCGI